MHNVRSIKGHFQAFMSIICKHTGLLFSIAVPLFLIFSFILAICQPKDINYLENRPAYQFPSFTLQGYLDSAFQNDMENALSDQIFGAQWMKKQFNFLNSSIVLSLLKPALVAHPELFFQYQDVYIHDGYILWQPFDLEPLKPAFVSTADSFNSIIRKNPDIGFYLYFVESDAVIDFQSGKRNPVYEYICQLMDIPEERCAKFAINSFPQYETEFYKTDHHWNNKGSYRGYLEILQLLECKDVPLQPLEEVFISYPMAGTKAVQVGLTELKETCSVYRFAYPELHVQYGHQEEVLSNPENSFFGYEYFYGTNKGLLTFFNENSENGNLLIIGDSFDNAILKLIASHYSHTYSVDLRNYEAETGTSFRFGSFLESYQIDNVLILASQVVFCGDYIVED